MQFLRVAVIVALVGCNRGDERIGVLEGHLADLQRRIGALENARESPAWWCTADRCERTRGEGAVPVLTAWCPRGDGPCMPTRERCGAGCVGVR